MELLKGFEPRPAHPENPQIDLQCAIADIRDLGRVVRRNAFDLGLNVDIGDVSIEFDSVDDSLRVYQELNGFINKHVIVNRRNLDETAGFIIIGYLDSSGMSFEEYIIRVPFSHNTFEFEVTDGNGIDGEEDVKEFRIEDLTDEQKIRKASFIRQVLEKVTQDLP